MAGFCKPLPISFEIQLTGPFLLGLDSLVVGSTDPKRKAFLKGPQSRNQTLFIEAITTDGRTLTPGIIFKGKEL